VKSGDLSQNRKNTATPVPKMAGQHSAVQQQRNGLLRRDQKQLCVGRLIRLFNVRWL
jgi:hypothetical protein